jgi:MYXO-CTERM domain-containing protein
MRTRILGWLGGLVLALLALTGTTGPAGATGLACDVTAFSGQVTKAGSPLTVRGTDGKDRAVGAGQGLVVVRNGTNAAFGDLREGDQVNVTVPAGAADCAATRIEAASTVTAAPEKDRTGLWGLLGLLGLAGLAGLLRRQPKPVHTTERFVEYPEPRATETVATVRPTERVEHVERFDPSDTRDTTTTRR